MGPGMTEELVDRIYEAAFVPDLWPDVLQRLSEASNSAAGAFILLERETPAKFMATDLIRPALEKFSSAGGWQSSEAVQMMFSLLPPAAFIYDGDYFPPEALAANRLRVDNTRPLGIGGQIGSFVPMPTGEIVLFTMDRWLDNDRPSERDLASLNGFRPHLARAGLMAARLRLERARTTASALQELGLPAAVLTSGGRLLALNDLLSALPDFIRTGSQDKVVLSDRAADALFRQAIAAYQDDHAARVRSIPVAMGDGPAGHVLHVVPLRRAARDIFSRGDVLIALTRASAAAGAPSPSILTSLFDLSPAEARLAASLATGLSIAAAAKANGVTLATARTYLNRVFAKTGTHRQSELVALARSVAPVGSDDAAAPVT